MADSQTLAEKYEELLAAGYITPAYPTAPLEMPTALVYVPTYSTTDTVLYDEQEPGEASNGKLVGDPERNQ